MKMLMKILLWAVAVVLLVVGVAGIAIAVSYQKTPLDMAQVERMDVATDQIYEFRDLALVDTYASYGSETEDDYVYVMAMHFDSDNVPVIFSIMLDVEDPVYAQFEEYLNDETTYYGDMTVSCYAYLSDDIYDETQREYYVESAQYFTDMLAEMGVGYHLTYWDCEYICDINEDYKPYANGMTVDSVIISVICVALAALLIFLALRKTKTPPAAPAFGQAPYTVGQAPYANAQAPYMKGEAPYANTEVPYTNEPSSYTAEPPTPTPPTVSAPPEDPADLTNRRGF